jgi:hypothetical protein
LLTLMATSGLTLILLTSCILCLDRQNLCWLQELDVLIHDHLASTHQPPATSTAQDSEEENRGMTPPDPYSF